MEFASQVARNSSRYKGQGRRRLPQNDDVAAARRTDGPGGRESGREKAGEAGGIAWLVGRCVKTAAAAAATTIAAAAAAAIVCCDHNLDHKSRPLPLLSSHPHALIITMQACVCVGYR